MFTGSGRALLACSAPSAETGPKHGESLSVIPVRPGVSSSVDGLAEISVEFAVSLDVRLDF